MSPSPGTRLGVYEITAPTAAPARCGRGVARNCSMLDGTGAMTRVPIQTAPTFSAGTPTTLFDTRYFTGAQGRAYDVSPDGQRFLMIKATTGTEQAARMVVVLNWLEELKAKLPAK